MDTVSVTTWEEFLRQAKIKFNKGGFKKLSDAHKQLAKDLKYRDLFHAQQALQKPAQQRSCYYFCGERDGDNFIPSIVKENEAGHFPMRGKDPLSLPYYWGKTEDEIEKRCLQMNAELGLSPEDVSDIVASSIRAQNLGERASAKQLEEAERAASKVYHRYVSEGSVNSAWLVEYHEQLDKILNAVSEYTEETAEALEDMQKHLSGEKRKVYIVTHEGKVDVVTSRRAFATTYTLEQAQMLGRDVSEFSIAKKFVTKAELKKIYPEEAKSSLWENAEVE